MDNISNLQLLFKRSSPGEWKYIGPFQKDFEGHYHAFGAVIPAEYRIIIAEGLNKDQACANTEFIAMAHNLMPYLIALVDLTPDLLDYCENATLEEDEPPDCVVEAQTLLKKLQVYK